MLDKLSRLRLPWALFLALMTGFVFYQGAIGFPIETNILKLLPETRTDPLTEQAYRQFESATGGKTVFLVGSEDAPAAKRAAEILHRQILESGVFSEVTFRVDPERAQKTYEVYLPHRQALLSEEQRQQLSAGHPDEIVNQATKSLMSPISMGSSASLTKDPLFTFLEFLKELQSQAGAFSMEDGLLVAEHDSKHYVILVASLQDNAFSIAAQASFTDFYKSSQALLKAQEPNVEVISAGVIHHAIAGTNSARQDISTIGVGSVVGLLLLIMVAFRSLGPLFVSAIPIVVGCISALGCCVLLFDKVHLFTLVFGSSLIGVSIDYCFHFLAERAGEGPEWDSQKGLEKIFPALTLGLFTTLAAYLALAVAPFSGLQQIAVFSAVGLASAYLTVVLWYPIFLKSSVPLRRPATLILAQKLVGMWDQRKPKVWEAGFLVLFVGLALYLSFHLRVNDDIRALQNAPEQVLREEELVKDIVGTSSGTQFFIVRGSTEDEVLSTEEQLTALLDEQISKGHLKTYRAITQALPSPSRQRENYELLRAQVLDDSSPVSRYLVEMGFEDEVVKNYRQSFEPESKEPLSVERWLESPLKDLYAPLWMGKKEENQFASILILDAVTNLDAMRSLEGSLEGVSFVSRADDISDLLKTYRELSTWLVVAAYVFIFFLRLFRYRLRVGLTMMIPPLGAGLLALSVSALTGVPLNLFNTLALILVLGIGIDYTIFFAERPDHRDTTMHAVLLSAVTTILSFGLLALSGTPVISSFGLMVFVGILASLLLAPVVGCAGRISRSPAETSP